MRIGICPGSFDPVTNGHIDIFERGSKLVDKLIVAVFSNPTKQPVFTMAEREEMLRETTKHIPNIEVASAEGLLNEYAMSHGATIIIRGLRALSDFEYEFQRALLMKQIEPAIETVFIMANTKYSYVSSTGIRELACFGGKLDGMVPDYVEQRLKTKFKDKYKV
ncbi:pantetheine-phosphate adenylyltransferase [Megasphaera hexanoica]|uniref:Phosphopantetheine adenylyltransferase n=1 Tax=Megasphaera hexanoica TaxID=1675036 RepID=A0A848BQI9_9FIRM|nr:MULTISPECIES: pantetheine-phosphate adenylyltransferase [Megasphaera]MCI5531290.1 pantetheine-phosphate adenylyltransferase [Caecibacter massiliensis]AXB80992.1 phosphopantetheine adenylyltransferase [Megasphaera hexanoica]KUH57298.1 phosphopantetheine adenylyltransferase [Megasphaera sp. DJF_B143]MDY2903451.1 pantetheine-phosphate adenylyltransferase [Caecibacter massiliensis]NME28601.1 pantetheine-phosphate adenylyltransferase [Megasphaera hexanoica]